MRFNKLAAFAALALVLSSAPAFAAKGMWSLGGNFGVGTYSNGDVNDQLASIGADKIKDGWEFGGTLRHGMSDKMSLELEGVAMNGKSETTEGTTTFTAHTKAFATPVNLLIGLAQNDTHDFSAIIGAGPMWNTKATSELSDGSSTISGESGSKTALMAQGGFEGDYFMSRQFALSGRVLGRYAKASDVDNDPNDPSAGTSDIDHSGFAFNLGLRVFFGGGQ